MSKGVYIKYFQIVNIKNSVLKKLKNKCIFNYYFTLTNI